MLSAFCAEGVEFVVVGGYAIAAHGRPRSTGDIDLFVRASAANAERVWRALKRFGAPLAGVSVRDFEDPDLIFQIGVEPCRIDVITSISGVDFESVWDRRIQFEVEGIVVPVIGREDLVANKRASGRHKDLADVEMLEGLAKLEAARAAPKPRRPRASRAKQRLRRPRESGGPEVP
ncbi:MAG: nucleotidyltransferase [Candidatus Riflebacteria bacterium]|nr:nucleotidyltransferase [Candidatus Riflebacteria bacterium]